MLARRQHRIQKAKLAASDYLSLVKVSFFVLERTRSGTRLAV